MIRTIARAAAILFMLLPPAHAQEKVTEPATLTAEQREMLERLNPTREHEWLATLEGRWTQEIRYAMGPGQTQTTTGTATNRMILGGRFLVSESVSANPMPDAPPVEAMTVYGFDRRTKEFTTVALDTFGTYYVTAAGRAAPPASPIVMTGEVREGQHDKKYDWVIRPVDRDTYVQEIVFYFDNGQSVKAVEITHRRVK